MNEPCGVFAGLWMMYGRDKSAPTPTVCLLLYIYALNKPCGVFVGLWMIVGRDESALTSTVCADIMQWINLVVCLLDYEMMYGRDKSAPTSTVCSLILCNEWALWSVCWYIYCAINRPYGIVCRILYITGFAELNMFFFSDCTGEMNLPLRLRNVRWYYAMNKPCGVFVGLWMIVGRDESAPTPTVCLLILCNEWALWCVCCIMKWCTGEINLPLRLRDVRCYTFTHWIDPVECPLIYILSNE